MADVVYRPFRAGDEAAINDGFNQVFGLHRPIEEWRWKFPAEPEGRWIMLAEDASGCLVGHYAAVPVRLQVGPLEIRAGQPCDVFTRVGTRHGLAAARTYIATVKAFFAEFGVPDRLSVLYGFPGDRALRLGLARLGYDEMSPQPVPVWRRRAARSGRLLTGHRVHSGFVAPTADVLWGRARARYAVAAVRNGGWIGRRFCHRPGVEYDHLTAWRHGEVVALAVVRTAGKLASWAELVWDGEDALALAALDRAVAALARARGADTIEMWLGGDPLASRVLSRLGWEEGSHPDNLVMVAKSFHPEVKAASFAGRFFLTMSDADLV